MASFSSLWLGRSPSEVNGEILKALFRQCLLCRFSRGKGTLNKYLEFVKWLPERKVSRCSLAALLPESSHGSALEFSTKNQKRDNIIHWS